MGGPNDKPKKFHVVDFDDCFRVIKTKDFMFNNKKNLKQLNLQNQTPQMDEMNKQKSSRDQKDKGKKRQFMIRSPADKEKEKL